ncbi:glucagon-2-like [Paramormyrops kingsleyae]|uniref:glucagon-2-like n=1 Tax=Paramormyrops kingsleyae TaxID=1676925 RepID=UPI000CD5D12C|nr:glucagon-like [Paramormyrops kingsleyae]
MTGIHSTVALVLLVVVQSGRQVLPQETEDSSSFLTENVILEEPRDFSHMKRHSQGTFTNDYSKYLETRRAQDFIQWLMNSKRSSSGGLVGRHADGTYTSDFSSYLQNQAGKQFVSWLKMGRGGRQ